MRTVRRSLTLAALFLAALGPSASLPGAAGTEGEEPGMSLESLRAYVRYLFEDGSRRQGQELQRAMELDPGSAFLRVEAARAALQERDLQLGIREAEEALRIDPDYWEAHELLGRIYTRLTELGGEQQLAHAEKAIHHLEAMVRLAEEEGGADEETWRALAELYETRARLDRETSAESLDRALHAWGQVGESSEGRERRARLLLELNRDEEALALLQAEVDDNPRRLRGRRMLTDVLESVGRWDDAVHQHRILLEADPQDDRVRLRLARALGRAGRDEEALAVFDELLSNEPPKEVRRVALFLSAELLEKNARFDEAEARLRQLVRLHPEDVDTRFELAEYLHSRGRHEEARRMVEAVLEEVEDAEETDGDTWFRLALRASELLSEQGQMERTAELLNEALDRRPEDATVSLALIETWQALGEYRKAERLAGRMRRKLPEPGTFWLLEGQVALLRGDLDRGRSILEDYLEADGSTPRGMAMVGAAWRTAGLPDEAAHWFHRAAEEEGLPAQVRDFRIQEALALADAGEIDRAESILRALDAEGLGNLESTFAMVQTVLMPREEFSEVLEVAREMMDEHPRLRAPRIWEIEALIHLDRLGEAEEAALGAAEQFPAAMNFPALRLEILARRGETSKALALAKNLASSRGGDLSSLLLMADRLREGGAVREAVDLLRGFSAPFQGHPQLEFALGVHMERLGEPEASARHMRAALEADPTFHGAMNYLGYTMVEHGADLQEARALIERALELDPRNPAYLDSLGWALLLEGRLDAAAEPLEEAARRVPNDPVVLMHLGRLREEQGRLQEAEAAYRRSLATGLDERVEETRRRLDHLLGAGGGGE